MTMIMARERPDLVLAMVSLTIDSHEKRLPNTSDKYIQILVQ